MANSKDLGQILTACKGLQQMTKVQASMLLLFLYPATPLVSGYYVIPFGVCPSVLTISDR